MAFRWSKGSSPLQILKRGIASLFICSVVLLPLIFSGIQVASWMGYDLRHDPRTKAPLAAMQVRDIDKSADAIKPFEQPLITVTFDDGWESIYSQAFPLLQQYGIPTTQYVLSGTSEDRNYMSFQQMVIAAKAGHDFQCHSVDHANLTQADAKQLMKQLRDCQTDIQKRVGNAVNSDVKDFASPYGAYNATTIDAIKSLYRSHRNTAGDITTNVADENDVNTKANFNRYDIIAVTVRNETTIQQLQSVIDYAVKNNGWLVLNYHQIDDENSQYGLDAKGLEAQLKVIAQANARIVTNDQVMKAMGF